MKKLILNVLLPVMAYTTAAESTAQYLEIGDAARLLKNYKVALKYYGLATKAGSVTGNNRLAQLYFLGQGVPRDFGKAKSLYEKSAAKKDPQAINNLGYMEANGLAFYRLTTRGYERYMQAAAMGYAPAQNNVGDCRLKGWGIQKDVNQAVKYYRLAAAQDYLPSVLNLATCYDQGLGVAQNHEEAEKLRKKAAELEKRQQAEDRKKLAAAAKILALADISRQDPPPASWTLKNVETTTGQDGNRVYRFNGKDSYIFFSTPATWTNFTFSVRVKPEALTGKQQGIMLQQGCHGGLVIDKDGNYAFKYWTASHKIFRLTGPAATVGQWANLAASYDKTTNQAVLLVNGKRVAEKTLDEPLLRLGGRFHVGVSLPPHPHPDWFNGKISDIRIYSCAPADGTNRGL